MIAAGDNPFRMQRLERLPFRPQTMHWEALWRRLEALDYRAAIVGAHGSGKTTLLEALRAPLEARGFTTRLLFTNHEQGPRLPADWRDALAQVTADQIVLADGYDVLHARARWRLRRATQQAGGLIVTTHRRALLPTLLRCQTSTELLSELTADLAGQRLPADQIEALYRRHHGNLRAALRELYDMAAAGRLGR